MKRIYQHTILSLFFTLMITSLSQAQTISLSPDSGKPGDMLTVTISGTGTTFSVSSTTNAQISNGNEIYGITGTASSSTAFAGTLDIPMDAASGGYDATIWQEGTTGTFWSCSNCFTIEGSCDLEVTGTVTMVDCNGDSTGGVDIEVTGGTSPVYAWSDGSTDQDLTNAPAGIYTVIVTDGDCADTAMFEITEPDPLVLSTSITDQNICPDDSAGSIIVSIMGGTAGYSVLWSDGQTTTVASALPNGIYTVTVQDTNGCVMSTVGDTITSEDPIVVSITSTTAGSDSSATGTATLTVSGGVGPYAHLWSNGDTGVVADTLAPGDYSVTTTDSNGCATITDFSILTVNCSISLTLQAVQPLCSGDSGIISATYMGFAADANVVWSNGSMDTSAMPVPPGIYTLTVSDGNGCSITDSIEVEAGEPIQITLDSMILEGDTAVTLDISVLGGTEPYTYNWSDTSGTLSDLEDLSGVGNGTYLITVSDVNGCSVSDTIMVNNIGTSSYSQYLEQEISIAPTLINESFTIDVPTKYLPLQTAVYDSQGRMLETKLINSEHSVFPFNHYGSGVYVLKWMHKGKFASKKMIKL